GMAAVPPPWPSNTGTSTNQAYASARSAVLADLAFAHPIAVGDRASDAQVWRLTLSGAGGATVEYSSPEGPAENGKGSFTIDLRHGAGSSGMDESGADDDLVAALLAAASDFGPIQDSQFLSGSAIATSLLTGIPPKADILPRKGSRLASVATLLLGEVSEETMAQPTATNDNVLPLRELLINPVRGKALSPSSATAIQDAGVNSPDKLGTSKPAHVPVYTVAAGSSLFLGATITI